MGPVTAWAGRVEILPSLPAFGYSTKLCHPQPTAARTENSGFGNISLNDGVIKRVPSLHAAAAVLGSAVQRCHVIV